jgi:cytochrome c553
MNKTLSNALMLFMLAGGVSAASAQQSGDAAAGQSKAAMCIGCHGIPGYRASFPEVHRVPMISGQSAKYIGAALAAYRKGERKHPTMRGIAGSLTDQDMADLSAFYEAQGGPSTSTAAPEPGAKVAELLKRGNCTSCHGEGLNKPIDAAYPKLAGQHPDYLYVALKAYTVENNPQVGRSNAIMSGQAKSFSHAEMKALAAYIGSLPGQLQTVPNPKFR